MKKRIAVLTAGICAMSLMLTGCSKEISNDYITISQYKGVEVEKQEVKKVSDEDVEQQIESIRQSNAVSKEITDRPAQDGDQVTIDYEGKKDGVAFDGGTAQDQPLTLGSNSFIDGFEEGIIGHNIGETFDLNLTFPEDYQPNPDLAGQAVVFTVTLDAISVSEVPELNDEFVKSVSEESKTVEEYKKEIKESMTKSNKETTEAALKDAAWTVVMDNTEVKKYPKEKLQDLIDMIKEQYQSMAGYYGMEFEEFLSQYMNMDEETFNTEVTKAAKEQLKQNLAVELIVKKAKVDVSEKALNKKYKEYAENYGYESADALKKAMKDAGNEENLEQMAKLEIVQEWVAENCKQVEKKSDDSDSSKSK